MQVFLQMFGALIKLMDLAICPDFDILFYSEHISCSIPHSSQNNSILVLNIILQVLFLLHLNKFF